MLEALFYPKVVAVYGASARPEKVGHEVVRNLKAAGFAGRIVPVNPGAEEVLGIPAFRDAAECGEPIELAVIAVPTPYVKASVDSALAAGAKAVVVITAGFREVGPEGALAEREIAEACRRAGARLMGPNCLGVINTDHAMNATFAEQVPRPGGISVISQSGALCVAILDWAGASGQGLGKMVSIGNKADLSEVDFLTAFAADEQTKVIMGYLESITAGDAFLRAAEEAAAKKPVVMIKAGTTQAGVKAAGSHTGSMAGGTIAYGAAFRRAGVIQARTLEELLDVSSALAMQPLPKGDRVAIITNGGGAGILAADAVELAGMRVTALGRGTATALRKKLPAAASVSNPIDVLGDADPERYVLAMNAAQDDPAVDAIVLILLPVAMTRPVETARAIAEAVRGEKPVLVSFIGGRQVLSGREVLAEKNIPDYPTPERAVAALRAMVEYAQWRHRPPRIVARFPVNRRRVERILHRHQRSGRLQVGEADAKAVLAAYGFHVPEGGMVATADEAVELAARIGLPVAMKVVSPDIVHKSDFGGVRLGLSSAEAVRDAFDLTMLRIRQRAPRARIEGAYVERMAAKGREVIIGMARDPQFGPMLMFGLGGIFVEVMKDVTFHLAPITPEEAMQMLRGTRSYALLAGARGQQAVDLEAIARGLQRLSQLVTDFPQIRELDVNPLLVGPVGTEPQVVDARMTLAAPEPDGEKPA
jgi:acetyltransferase